MLAITEVNYDNDMFSHSVTQWCDRVTKHIIVIMFWFDDFG